MLLALSIPLCQLGAMMAELTEVIVLGPPVYAYLLADKTNFAQFSHFSAGSCLPNDLYWLILLLLMSTMLFVAYGSSNSVFCPPFNPMISLELFEDRFCARD